MKQIVRKSLSWLLTGILLICPVFAASVFPDVDANCGYAEAVEYVKSIGIMVGDDNGNFNPNRTVTRAEMAVIMCNFLGETANLTATTQFSDVPMDHWANKYIGKAAELGVIGGYGNGKCGPSDEITYEQALTMLVSAVGLSEAAQQNGGYPNGYIEIAQKYGYIEGLSAKCGDMMNRWQIAVLFYNCMKI